MIWPIDEPQTIPVKFKRRLSYKYDYLLENIRPLRVLKAAQYLVENRQLFKDEGIEVDSSYLDTCSKDFSDGQLDNKEGDESCDETDAWCEVEERPAGILDTLLIKPDVNQDDHDVLSFAPGEGNKPLRLSVDQNSEYLSFPTIFCGKKRADNTDCQIPLQCSAICKWELRCQDCRVAESVPNRFYKLKKLQIKRIQDSAHISIRKCKTKGKKYTAGDIKTETGVNKLIHLDEGYRVPMNLRGSPPYFEKCKRDLFAMITQLGKPTWFCSFSAAETRWLHLLKILGRLVENKQYTDDEISNMTWQKKSELIRKDPVACTRNFAHMFRLFLNTFLRSKQMAIGEIEDFFYRVEFQQRGSPHIHALFWVKDAPQLGKDSNSDITAFVDKYVSCANDSSGAVNTDTVNLQLHRDAKTCKRKGQNICRFNFPIFPMPLTMILKPLDISNLDKKEIEHLKTNLTNITNLLTDMKLGSEINFRFDTFLKKLSLTVNSYILSIRYSLKCDTLFLKRSPLDIRINMYDKDLLKAWRANLDIQYVLDAYSRAAYILSYITKGQSGMSRLVERACHEAKSGNKDVINQVRHIGNKFLNAVEISGQEAVYLTLQLPLRR